MKVEEIFITELRMIQNPDIREFVIICFNELCPDYFWTCPCSISGKYHPQVSLGEGGLVRHTKLAVWWGLELVRALGSSPELEDIPTVQLQDEVIATLLVHDMIKNGEGLDSGGHKLDHSVTGTHGVTLADKIYFSKIYLDNDDSFYRIIDGISGHMGIWTTIDARKPDTAFANLIHLADYCASRKVDDKILELNKAKSDEMPN